MLVSHRAGGLHHRYSADSHYLDRSGAPTGPFGSSPPSSGLHGGPSCSSLSPSRYIIPTTCRSPIIVRRNSRTCSSSSGAVSNGSSSQLVAIDSKIEQAMDLVKTHLMFAVREEVEVLRGRIVDLENTVCNLEAENAVLRKHVSEDILRNLSLS